MSDHPRPYRQGSKRMIDWKLEDRVMIAYGPDAGRVGTVTAIEAGYHVHLDHPADVPCERKTFYPIHLVRPPEGIS